ncbi:ATP-binding protein [Rhodococcus sp. SGAir0479]|uniref:ATP-binding protein n=1 Tax=Rhodococcus sp. SGAir0479 TaxID=2567884 RepID=UPI0010CD42A3|nr:LuxR C-terminal-related transcriptional regulator [Rhodococcus sp. SGAir0479]QCQ93665.1 LuxR family transcriptional regulator [Rhodococcus sp. SGAir0479]
MAVKQGNLPSELTSFVGRRFESAEARRLLSESRVLTLTGLGGVGKTRLALHVADEARRAYPGGTWFVDLSELQEPALLDQTVLTALGIQDRSVRSPRTVLIEHLGDDRALLILDNCEHLLGPVAVLVTELLRNCAGLTVLATSRAPLGVPGERVMRVPPLAVSTEPSSAAQPETTDGDAVALFEQRARAAMPDFRVTDANRAVVGEIVRRLEGLPLPIELAAARLRAMPVDQILRRLNDRFEFLTRGSRTAPNRQQALKWSIDWGYDLCTPSEQWLWARLAIFAGSFDLDAVEGILGGEATDEDLVDLVTSLVDKSVLIREAAGASVRFRMLETLRDYGRGLLLDEECAALQRRHRDWYRQLVLRGRADWISSRQVDWANRFDLDRADVREAMDSALRDADTADPALQMTSALLDFWIARGRLSEGRYWLDRALARHDGSVADRLDAAVADSLLAALQQDTGAGSALAAEARGLAAQLCDDTAGAFADFATGMVLIAEGELRAGIEHLERTTEPLRSRHDFHRLVPAMYWLGCALFAVGDLDRAAAVYREQLDLTEPRGEIMWRAMAMSDYGSVLWRQGSRARGEELLEESLALLRELGNKFGCAWCFEELAWASARRSPELAAELMGAADAQFTATGSPMAIFENMVAYHDECVDQSRRQLGQKGFRAAFDRGRALGVEEAIVRALAEQPPESAEPAAAEDALTPRELQVAELVARGLTNKAIAEKLVISQRTVEGHVEHIRDKLGFGSRTQIATWLLRRAEGGDGTSAP